MFPLLLSLGLVYFVALGAGRVAARLRVPRVTGYLIAGLLTGPSAAKLIGIPPVISSEQLDSLAHVHDIALGLIVLAIGSRFNLVFMRKLGPKLVIVAGVEIVTTAFLVGTSALLFGASPPVAGFLAIMAITTAPATTQMVVREYESEGPLTDLIMTILGLNDLMAIFAFVFLFHYIVTPAAPLWHIILQLGIPAGIGVATGGFMALMDLRLSSKTERQILGISVIAGLIGASRAFGVSPILAGLTAGAILVNSSPHGDRIVRDLGGIDYPLYILFFVLAGADLHLAYLPHMGAIGFAYVFARSLGKITGARLGALAAKMDKNIRTWLGPALLAQAGLAIGLSEALAVGWGENGIKVKTAVLAAVVVFEGVGPLLTRRSLVQAGEVTILSLLFQRSRVGYFEGLHELVEHFREALGIPQFRLFKKPSDILVEHVMRRNVEVIKHDMPFDGILRTFGHSRYDRLPVVDESGHFVGIIKYSDVSEVLFDPSLRNLVLAGDIATQENILLTPSDTLEIAMHGLRSHPEQTYLLVVDEQDSGKLVGVVRHNDVLSVQRSLGKEK